MRASTCNRPALGAVDDSVEITRVIAVDWSGARAGVRKKLWLAEARGGRLVRLECGRDRDELTAHLVELAREDPRLVVGLDFAFSMPAWFLRERAIATGPELWRLVEREGESWLARCEPPFWGKPVRPRPELATGRSFYRRTESERLPVRGIAPKSVFQVGGAGSVGTGSLRGMPKLSELAAAGFSIWPFEVPRFPLVVEIYPRWLTGRVRKARALARRLDLASRAAAEDRALVEIAVSSEDAFDAAVSALTMARCAGELLALAIERDPTFLLEGRIWSPRADALGFTCARSAAGTEPAPSPPPRSRAR